MYYCLQESGMGARKPEAGAGSLRGSPLLSKYVLFASYCGLHLYSFNNIPVHGSRSSSLVLLGTVASSLHPEDQWEVVTNEY